MLNKKQACICFSLLAVFSIFGYAQKSPKVDFAKKMQEATPQSLPQEPIAKKLKSDAQDNNLKGKVKSVIEFTQESGKTIRERYSEEYYNKSGNLVKDISYEEGYPSSVTVWGYIDGNRVITSNFINYTEKERPPSSRMSITISAEDNALNPDAPRDKRFQMKLTYKYNEQGQLSEKWLYQNNGEVWTHKVYNYKGNQREDIGYDQRGSEMSQTIEILDKDGNVIERNFMDADGKVSSKNIQTYEFDSQGNWIVEKTFEQKKVKGKAVQKLLWTSYRTITYYQ